MRFIHTADWQIGKPFAGVPDSEKRARLRQARIEAVSRVGEVAREERSRFVLVGGDVFDTSTPDKGTVSAACHAIGSIGIPVFAISGNHDHAGPGTIWKQEFFLREQRQLAPNFRLLDAPQPVEHEGVIILPCPLVRRQESDDVTAWLHGDASRTSLPCDKPRIILAHGSTQGFTSVSDGEETPGQANLIDLSRLPAADFDYIALGDWHGTKQVAPHAWYSGTPELDRFMKGGDYDPGNVLSVEVTGRGTVPAVTRVRTAQFGWHDLDYTLVGDGSISHLETTMADVVGSRVQQDLLRLSLCGKVGFEGDRRLRVILESLEARLLRVKLENMVQVLPSDDEIRQLTQRPGDPLVSAIAGRLWKTISDGGSDSDRALRALRELYVAITTEVKKG